MEIMKLWLSSRLFQTSEYLHYYLIWEDRVGMIEMQQSIIWE